MNPARDGGSTPRSRRIPPTAGMLARLEFVCFVISAKIKEFAELDLQCFQ